MDKIRVVYHPVYGVSFSMDDEERAIIHENVPQSILGVVREEKERLDAICVKIAEAKAAKNRDSARELISELQLAEAFACGRANRVLK